MNKVIANIGAKAFFSMLMKHNFVHADCHAGNILVKIREDPNSIKTQLLDFFNKSKNYLISQVIKYGFDS
jgi:predicted unusual protein kinase regulating ubiquinone biosynthesis (AarF/ABC1/UbiB family)